MFQRDYILRLIDAVAQVVARALRAMVQKKQPEEAEQALAEGYRTLSLDREFLLVLDGPSIRTHCGNDDEKLALAVRLLLCDCEVQVLKGDGREARRTLKAAKRALAQVAEKPEDLSAELIRMTQAVDNCEQHA